MNNEKEFKEKLDKIMEKSIITTKTWWGHEYPGYSGIIVTNNKEIYIYQYYFRVPKEVKENEKEFWSTYILKKKDLNDEEFQKIIMFIESEIENKQFTDKMIFDAGYDLFINYNGLNMKIQNNKEHGDNLGIYDKAEMLLNELLK